MGTILDRIIETKRAELADAQRRRPLADVQRAARDAGPPRDLYGALAVPPPRTLHVIAEIKKRSPSAGLIRPDFDPAAIASIYHAHAASAISVLTDAAYFDGRLEYIETVRNRVPLPVLRKDFTIDPYQVYEARAAGADAVLLIGEVLEPACVSDLRALACTLGMTSLIEVHAPATLDRLLETIDFSNAERTLLGINNRDLKVQRTDLAVTERVAGRVPPGVILVSESGVRTAADMHRLARAGARAVLVGETLMRAPDIGRALDALFDDRPDPASR